MPANQEYYQTIGVQNPGGPGNPGGAYNQPVWRGGQNPQLSRYAPPMLGNATDPHSWVGAPGPYSYNLPNAFGPGYGYGQGQGLQDQRNAYLNNMFQQAQQDPQAYNPQMVGDMFNRMRGDILRTGGPGAPTFGGGSAYGQVGGMAGNPQGKPSTAYIGQGGPVYGGGGMTKPLYNAPTTAPEVVEQPVRYDPVSRPGPIFGSPTGAPRAATRDNSVSPQIGGPRFQRQF